jgi:hypothetical protein
MQDHLGLLQRLGAIPELQPVNCAGWRRGSPASTPPTRRTSSPTWPIPARPRSTTGFVLTQLYGRQGPIHVIGNVLFALGAVTLLLVAVRTARRSAVGAAS